MRTPKRVKQEMYYSIPKKGEPIYAKDENGNIIYDVMPDGVEVARVVGESPEEYSKPVKFYNSITGELTADELQAFGTEAKGKCKMTYKKDEFPFVVNTLIWKNTCPQNPIDKNSADFRIIGIQDTGRFFYKALLVKVV